jgi:hypothetical protein
MMVGNPQGLKTIKHCHFFSRGRYNCCPSFNTNTRAVVFFETKRSWEEKKRERSFVHFDPKKTFPQK